MTNFIETKDIKMGDSIKSKNFKNREKYVWLNESLGRLEICPTRPMKVHSDEDFDLCFSVGKEEKISSSEEEYKVYETFRRENTCVVKAKGKISGEKIYFSENFPEIELISRNENYKPPKKKKPDSVLSIDMETYRSRSTRSLVVDTGRERRLSDLFNDYAPIPLSEIR